MDLSGWPVFQISDSINDDKKEGNNLFLKPALQYLCDYKMQAM